MVKEIHGKFRLDASTVLMPSERKIDAEVYIHLKGYARARVSHLDVEKVGLGKFGIRPLKKLEKPPSTIKTLKGTKGRVTQNEKS